MAGDSADVVLKAVERRAMEIVALPEDEREARYSLIREVYRNSAISLGRTEQQANDIADKVVEFTRDLVVIIERSGGADIAAKLRLEQGGENATGSRPFEEFGRGTTGQIRGRGERYEIFLLVAAVTFSGPVFAFDLSLAVQRLSEVGPICVQHGNPAFAEKTDEEIAAACNETEALLAAIEANGYCQGDRPDKWIKCSD
jgi:hypothetical protein